MKYFITIILFLSFSALAQDSAVTIGQIDPIPAEKRTDTTINSIDDKDMESDSGIYNLLTTKEFWLSIGLIALLLVILGLEIHLIRNRNFSEDATIKLLIITIIIMGALFLFVAGYSDKQVAPAFGLFGAISGYIFGKSSSNKNDSN